MPRRKNKRTKIGDLGVDLDVSPHTMKSCMKSYEQNHSHSPTRPMYVICITLYSSFIHSYIQTRLEQIDYIICKCIFTAVVLHICILPYAHANAYYANFIPYPMTIVTNNDHAPRLFDSFKKTFVVLRNTLMDNNNCFY